MNVEHTEITTVVTPELLEGRAVANLTDTELEALLAANAGETFQTAEDLDPEIETPVTIH